MLDSGLLSSHQLFLAAMMVSVEEGEPLLALPTPPLIPCCLLVSLSGKSFLIIPAIWVSMVSLDVYIQVIGVDETFLASRAV